MKMTREHKYFAKIAAYACVFTLVVCASAADAQTPTTSSRSLSLSRYQYLPINDLISPGSYDPARSGPFPHGPTAYAVSTTGDVFIGILTNGKNAILRIDSNGKILESYVPEIAEIVGQPFTISKISCAGKWLFAATTSSSVILVWEIGKPLDPIKLHLPDVGIAVRPTISQLWGQISGDAIVMLPSEKSTAIFKLSTRAKAKQIIIPAQFSDTDEKYHLYFASSDGVIYITESDYAKGDKWILDTISEKGDLLSSTDVALPRGYHCFSALPVGLDSKNNFYVVIDAEPGEDSTGQMMWRVYCIASDHRSSVLGEMPHIPRFYIRCLDYQESADGGIYLLYPTETTVPKGDPIKIALGTLK